MRLIFIFLLTVTSSSFAQNDLIFLGGFEFVARLNDTGITWAGEYSSGNNTDCTSTTITSPQDCNQGQDANALSNGGISGSSGFNFTKLDVNGAPLDDQSVDYDTTAWACVQDNVTGLVWEVKTKDGGIHDKNDSYSWYNTNTMTNGGADGSENYNGFTCLGYNSSDNSTFCNTQAFVARINAQGLCGKNDWRLPDINELFSILNLGRISPTIDTNLFPNTNSGIFWSSNPNSSSFLGGWGQNFNYGYSENDVRVSNNYVRLVRGGQ